MHPAVYLLSPYYERYWVLPVRPAGTDALSEAELAGLVTRDSMIGVGPRRPPSREHRVVSAGMRPDATELGEARRRVEALVADLPAGRAGEHAFNEPWEIRAFAMAVAAYHNGQYEWSEFQLSLIESIRQWERSGRDPEDEPWSYYEHWLTALETVLAGSGLLSESMLDERTKSVLATPRNANHQRAHPEPVAVDPPVH